MTDKTLKIIKIGGNVIDDTVALYQFIEEFSQIDAPKILVHGGGKIATRIAAQLGIETKMINGRRVTSKGMLDVTVMVYAGLINKSIVAALQSKRCNAIGLCGADAGCITSTRRNPQPVDYGEVGDIVSVNASALLSLIDAGFTPVICAITADDSGALLNTNADSVATAVAMAVSEKVESELVYCFDKPGVMRDINDGTSVIETITPLNVTTLVEEGIISDGMLPKVENALKAITSSNLKSVRIRSSKSINVESGTKITK